MWLMQLVHTRLYANKALLLLESALLPLSDFISHSYCVNISLQNGKVAHRWAVLCAQVCSDNVVDT